MRARRPLLALAALAVGLPLLPAAAGTAPEAAPTVVRAGASAAAAALLDAPDEQALGQGLRQWERSLRDGLRGADVPALRASAGSAPAPLPEELGFLDAVGDVDGDRLPEVLDLTDQGTTVRSGRTGAVLGRRAELLVGLGGSGSVRLLALESSVEEVSGGFEATAVLRGLDAGLRTVWERSSTGTVRFVGSEAASAVTLEQLPLLLGVGGTAVVGTLSGGESAAGSTGTLQVDAVDLQTGEAAPLASVRGAGSTLPSAALLGPVGPGGECLATLAPVGPRTSVGLVCGGAQRWSAQVDLAVPFVSVAGRFPGDAVPDLLVSDSTFQAGAPGGSRVLSGADGALLTRSDLSDLLPLGVDASGDGEPDVQRPLFEEALGVEGLTLAGKRLYRREARLSGSGGTSLALGLDLSGDGVPDALLTAQPEGGRTLTAVVEGRRGGVTLRDDVDGLQPRGLRGRGVDLLVRDLDAGRLRVTSREAVGGRVLRRSTVPRARGTAGAPGRGAVVGVHLDGDGRRDLVVVSRVGTTRLITALRADGRLLWQQRERAAAPPAAGGASIG